MPRRTRKRAGGPSDVESISDDTDKNSSREKTETEPDARTRCISLGKIYFKEGKRTYCEDPCPEGEEHVVNEFNKAECVPSALKTSRKAQVKEIRQKKFQEMKANAATKKREKEERAALKALQPPKIVKTEEEIAQEKAAKAAEILRKREEIAKEKAETAAKEKEERLTAAAKLKADKEAAALALKEKAKTDAAAAVVTECTSRNPPHEYIDHPEIPGKKICRIICDPVTERHSKDFKQCINLEEERRARETAKTEGIQKGKEKAFLRNQTICLSKGEDYEYVPHSKTGQMICRKKCHPETEILAPNERDCVNRDEYEAREAEKNAKKEKNMALAAEKEAAKLKNEIDKVKNEEKIANAEIERRFTSYQNIKRIEEKKLSAAELLLLQTVVKEQIKKCDDSIQRLIDEKSVDRVLNDAEEFKTHFFADYTFDPNNRKVADSCMNSENSKLNINQLSVYIMAKLRARDVTLPRGLLVNHGTGAGKTIIGVLTMLAFWDKTYMATDPRDGSMKERVWCIMSLSTNDNQLTNNSSKVLAKYIAKYFQFWPLRVYGSTIYKEGEEQNIFSFSQYLHQMGVDEERYKLFVERNEYNNRIMDGDYDLKGSKLFTFPEHWNWIEKNISERIYQGIYDTLVYREDDAPDTRTAALTQKFNRNRQKQGLILFTNSKFGRDFASNLWPSDADVFNQRRVMKKELEKPVEEGGSLQWVDPVLEDFVKNRLAEEIYKRVAADMVVSASQQAVVQKKGKKAVVETTVVKSEDNPYPSLDTFLKDIETKLKNLDDQAGPLPLTGEDKTVNGLINDLIFSKKSLSKERVFTAYVKEKLQIYFRYHLLNTQFIEFVVPAGIKVSRRTEGIGHFQRILAKASMKDDHAGLENSDIEELEEDDTQEDDEDDLDSATNKPYFRLNNRRQMHHCVFIMDEMQLLFAPPMKEIRESLNYERTLCALEHYRDLETTYFVGLTATPGFTLEDVRRVITIIGGDDDRYIKEIKTSKNSNVLKPLHKELNERDVGETKVNKLQWFTRVPGEIQDERGRVHNFYDDPVVLDEGTRYYRVRLQRSNDPDTLAADIRSLKNHISVADFSADKQYYPELEFQVHCVHMSPGYTEKAQASIKACKKKAENTLRMKPTADKKKVPNAEDVKAVREWYALKSIFRTGNFYSLQNSEGAIEFKTPSWYKKSLRQEQLYFKDVEETGGGDPSDESSEVAADREFSKYGRKLKKAANFAVEQREAADKAGEDEDDEDENIISSVYGCPPIITANKTGAIKTITVNNKIAYFIDRLIHGIKNKDGKHYVYCSDPYMLFVIAHYLRTITHRTVNREARKSKAPGATPGAAAAPTDDEAPIGSVLRLPELDETSPTLFGAPSVVSSQPSPHTEPGLTDDEFYDPYIEEQPFAEYGPNDDGREHNYENEEDVPAAVVGGAPKKDALSLDYLKPYTRFVDEFDNEHSKYPEDGVQLVPYRGEPLIQLLKDQKKKLRFLYNYPRITLLSPYQNSLPTHYKSDRDRGFEFASGMNTYGKIDAQTKNAATIDYSRYHHREEKVNIDGDIIPIILATGEAYKGINLSGIRHIHLLDPFVDVNDLIQLMGRGPRMCSHTALKESSRKVNFHIYMSKYAKEFVKEVAVLKKDGTVKKDKDGEPVMEKVFKDVKEKTLDWEIYEQSVEEYKSVWYGINQAFQEVAYDRVIFAELIQAASQRLEKLLSLKCGMFTEKELPKIIRPVNKVFAPLTEDEMQVMRQSITDLLAKSPSFKIPKIAKVFPNQCSLGYIRESEEVGFATVQLLCKDTEIILKIRYINSSVEERLKRLIQDLNISQLDIIKQEKKEEFIDHINTISKVDIYKKSKTKKVQKKKAKEQRTYRKTSTGLCSKIIRPQTQPTLLEPVPNSPEGTSGEDLLLTAGGKRSRRKWQKLSRRKNPKILYSQYRGPCRTRRRIRMRRSTR